MSHNLPRMERVYEKLSQYDCRSGITAGELADLLDITRANCSHDLNRLCDEGRAEKRGRKPVYYYARKRQREVEFLSFIKENPSLTKCGDLARAAVLYPPHGMNILLLGETGVGKSMFAEMIYSFACSMEKIRMPGRFVQFNCADYADNPQLLLSQLFGVMKGAYTGALNDRQGLFEAADGGILFLDEVHRLPAVGQEMLFTYIDKGVFRRLGEAFSERKAQVMLICATTEEPKSALLQTFLRRLPVVIQIPNLNERSLEERQHLIALFFSQEAKRLGYPILVTVNSLRALLGYHCSGNIGQLSSDIRLLCARAYADYVSGTNTEIQVSSYSLPAHIRNGFLNDRSRKEIWNTFAVGHERFFRFLPDDSKPDFHSSRKTDIYDLMENQTSSMKRVGMPEEAIHSEISSLMQIHYQNYKKNQEAELFADDQPDSEITATTDKMLELAHTMTKRIFSPNVRYGLSRHLCNTLKRLRDNKPIKYPGYEEIAEKFPEEWTVAVKCLSIFEEDFVVKLPMDEAAFIVHFFTSDTVLQPSSKRIKIIVAAHGTGIGSGMAEIANHLFDTDISVGFDMPMTINPYQIIQRIKAYLQEYPDIREILLLVDMGSLVGFAEEISEDSRINVRTLSLVSTLHVVEAARMVIEGKSLEQIYQSIKKITNVSLDSTEIPAIAANPKLYIVITENPNSDTAVLLRQILERQLDLENCFCQLVYLSFSDFGAFRKKLEKLEDQGKIIAVISSDSPEIQIPVISTASILNKTAISNLQKRLNWESLRFRISDNISDLLEGLEAQIVVETTHQAVSKIVRELNMDLPEDMLVGILSHLIFMINRLKNGQETPVYPNKEGLYRKYPGVVTLVERECRHFEQVFPIQIPEDEIYYISAFFTKEDLLHPMTTWNR